MAKMLGVSVKKATKLQDDLIATGYMEVLYASDKIRCVRKLSS
jgi:helix-turn-helix protein